MLQIIETLSQEEIRGYYNNKIGGYIPLLIDTKNSDIYLLEKETDTFGFACNLLNKKKEELKKDSFLASHLVSSTLIIDKKGFIANVTIGVSSLEIVGKIIHTKGELEKANALLTKLLSKSSVVRTRAEFTFQKAA